jgi:hypothetical protein
MSLSIGQPHVRVDVALVRDIVIRRKPPAIRRAPLTASVVRRDDFADATRCNDTGVPGR